MNNLLEIGKLLEVGAHFGHQIRKWNPKMAKYIFTLRNGMHIIDLRKTLILLNLACEFINKLTKDGGKILFVGTKKQAKNIISEESIRGNQYYVNNRWLGGTLTNFVTIKKSVERLSKIEDFFISSNFSQYTNKEIVKLNKVILKLRKNLYGIKNMVKIPEALFVIDVENEKIAVKEANKLNIPVIAMIDTNSDPEFIDYPIPCNDDSSKVIKLILAKIIDNCYLNS